MSKDATIQARINGDLKKKVEKILQKLGLSHSEAINVFYNQLEMHQGLPFSVKIPNKETINAMKDSISGNNLKKFDKAEDLFDELRKI
ncbi:MAG: type II toxin-antitoxin system RelB/DinJ family antitoxin [Spirochaetia bacterium]|nr:type II toxin-antitoxin system RelB/DinJ family antitoxin [Spirochaetia bacterium]